MFFKGLLVENFGFTEDLDYDLIVSIFELGKENLNICDSHFYFKVDIINLVIWVTNLYYSFYWKQL